MRSRETGSFPLRDFAPVVIFGTSVQRFDKSGGGHRMGRWKNCCRSITFLLRTTRTRTIGLQDHTSVSVTDTVTEVMSLGIFKEFMQRLGGAEHDFWELKRLGITTVDYSERNSLAYCYSHSYQESLRTY